MAETTTATYVRLLYPGSFFPEETCRIVSHRDPARTAREAPAGVFAFTFFDRIRASVTADGQEVELSSEDINASGRYYIDAEKLTAADVAALPGDHHILLSNMRANRWDVVVRCRTGNFQPLEPGDEMLSSESGG